jgi:hypothetical protein
MVRFVFEHFLEERASVKEGMDLTQTISMRFLNTSFYPDRPDREQDTREIVPGWCLGTTIANSTKKRLPEAAGRAARLRFGRDLQIHLPNT